MYIFVGRELDVPDLGAFAGVFRLRADLIGRGSNRFGLREESVPRTWAAFDGIAGGTPLAGVLLNVGRLTPKSFFLGLLLDSSFSIFFSPLAALH
jgi:hypothetical protein